MRFILDNGLLNEKDGDEEIISAILSREVAILRERGLQEIRETQLSNDLLQEGAVMGSPVSVRLMIPQLSILPCVNNSFRQISHLQKTRGNQIQDCVSLTPECHIIISKATEQMISEISTRAFLDASRGRSPETVNHLNIIRSLPVWNFEGGCSTCPRSDFAFANDTIDRFSEQTDNPLDILSALHR